MKSSLFRKLILAGATVLLASCVTLPIPEEAAARERVTELAYLRAELPRPVLEEGSKLEDYLRFALLSNPRLAAAHAEWRASVEDITLARSLPAPKLTFEADIADMLMTLMPGLMFDVMGPGKRAAMGREAAARADVAYQAYRATALEVATDLKKTWADLAYLDAALTIRGNSLAALDRSLAFASADYATGKGMGTLEDQVNLGTETERVRIELANLADEREAVRARLKAVLGLRRDDPAPAWPARFSASPAPADEDALWVQALASNPSLSSMREMVGMAVAEIAVARKSRVPDFGVGGMVDLKADPLMARTQAEMTLPIWRDQIAATIAAAEHRREAAAARLGAEKIMLAAELAQMTYMLREADRMIAFIDATALPGIERAIDSAQAGYQSGMASLATVPALELMALNMRLERASAVRERERALADLSLLLAGQASAGWPLLANKEPR